MFWPARKFTDLADLKSQTLLWCFEADERVHNGLGRTPKEAFEDERSHLRALPERSDLFRFERRLRKVQMDGFIFFAGVKDGVPARCPNFAGEANEAKLTTY